VARLSLLLLLALCGCDESSSRLFAVTVLDTARMDCKATTNSDEIEQLTIDALADDIRRAWQKTQETYPPTPLGRLLYVVTIEQQVLAWFDPAWGAEENPSHHRYDDPGSVYQGELQDDLIAANFEELINTDDVDEDFERELCGARPIARGVLSLTDGDALQGRIRWSDYSYIATADSACAASIVCSRDILVEGAEID